MKFFIDTANIEEILEADSFGILDGVTTNPSLMAKVGVKGRENVLKHYSEICQIMIWRPVSAEVISTKFEDMVAEGKELQSISDNIVIKIPMTPDGIKAIHKLQINHTNCTLIFSPGQALVAAKAGATYVSPFVGRLDDVSSDGLELLRQIKTIYSNYKFDTKILAASIRHPMHIIECAKIGVDVMTGPLSAMKGLMNHPLTDIGLDIFLRDYKKVEE